MRTIRLRQPLLPLLAAFLFGLQWMEPSRVWVILLVIFLGLLASAFSWTWILGRNLNLRRESRLGWILVGGRIEERLTLTNASSLPAPIISICDNSNLPGFDASRSTGLGAGSFDQWSADAICERRGLYRLGDARVRLGDPFGIFEAIVHVPQTKSILVLPRIAPLPPFQIAPANLGGESMPRRNALQQSIHAATVREYMYGDSRRQIHWPTTARKDKLHVRLMENTPEGGWWIVLDLDEKTMLGSGWDSIEEQGVTLAASLAEAGLRNRKSVGFICNGDELAWHPPQKGEGQRWEIMQALAMARPGTQSLSDLLDRISPSLSNQHSLVLITACVSLDWLESILSLTKRGLNPTILLFDPTSYGGSGSVEYARDILIGRGIHCHVIRHGMISIPGNQASQLEAWKWRTTRSGDLITIHS